MTKRIASVFLVFAVLITQFCFNAGASAAYSDAEAFVVINADTETVMDGKNIHKRLPMASTTKIMTAIILCENVIDMSETIVTTKEMVTVEGSSMGLLEGDTVSYHDLLYGLLLASGNDAANTIAISLCGSLDAFVDKMNAKAAELGLENTCFETPSGLDGENHYTSAYDLARIAAYALSIPMIREATSTQKATLNYGNPPYKRSVTNHNKLLGSFDGAIGVKTGFTKKSGRCLVTAAERGNATVIVVTLNAANDYENHKTLLNAGFGHLSDNTLSDPVAGTKLALAGTQNEIGVKTQETVLSLCEGELEQINASVYLPEFVYAPVDVGETVGWVEYKLNGKIIAVADIVAADSAKAEPARNNTFLQRTMWNFMKMLMF